MKSSRVKKEPQTCHVLLDLRWDYVPINPLYIENNKSEMHGITQPDRTSQLSPAYLKSAWNTHISLQLGKVVSLPPSSSTREYCMDHYPEKRSKIKIRTMVSTECISLSHHHRVKQIVSEATEVEDRLYLSIKKFIPELFCS